MEEKLKNRFIDDSSSTWLHASIGEEDAGTFDNSAIIKGKFSSMLGAFAMGVQGAFSDTSYSPLHASSLCEVYNERDSKSRAVYLSLLTAMSSLPRAELQPGQRREAIQSFARLAEGKADVFLEAFERIYHTESKKIGDRAKSTALRFSGDFVDSSRKAEHVAFLIAQLESRSPAQASAAAVSLGEVADAYSAPALTAAMKRIVWPSVRQDVAETLGEIKSHD